MNRIGLTHCFAVLLAVMLITAGQTAWGADEKTAASFIEHFDKDGDGLLSADEFPGDEDHFNQLDKDGDGYISELETPQGPPPPGGSGHGIGKKGGFETDDVDQDERVSKEEFSGPEDLFDKLDADGDGYISKEEAVPPRPGNRPERGADQQ